MTACKNIPTILLKPRLTQTEFIQLPPKEKLKFEMVEKWVPPTHFNHTGHVDPSPARFDKMYVLIGGLEGDAIRTENEAAELPKGGRRSTKGRKSRNHKKRTTRRR